MHCYLDDILVTGSDDEQHLKNVNEVLSRLDEFGLCVQREKCEFFKDTLEYLGHIIDAQGLHKSPEKVRTIVDAPKHFRSTSFNFVTVKLLQSIYP